MVQGMRLTDKPRAIEVDDSIVHCRDCRFWVKGDKLDGDGYCHEGPPQMFMIMQLNPLTREQTMTYQSNFRPVSPTEWCGSGKLRKN